jgi:hypothetical protein
MKNFKVILFAVMLIPGFTALAQNTTNDEYPTPIGHLRFNVPQVTFNNIYNTETKTDTLKLYNDWNQNMTITIGKLPEYMTCQPLPGDMLKAKKKGSLVITFNAARRNDFGFVNDRITLTTNDSVQPVKTINLSANILENFSVLTPEQFQNAPKIKFDKTTYNFDTIKEGDKVECDFAFSNIGKSELIIRKTRGSCGCTVGTPEKSNLKPDENSKIHVTFNSAGKSGPQHKTVTIICNDPSNSTAIINIEGTVIKKEDPGTKPPPPKK